MELEPSRRLALVVEYDGTDYCGFQLQVALPTVQGDIESALTKVTGETIRIVGAGRTDSGVHARGQVVSFTTLSTLPPETMVRALNFYLGPGISVRSGHLAASDFDARRDALSREYRYTILNRSTPSPLERRYACFVPWRLDIDPMNAASGCLVGCHDFASFTGPTGRSTVREVHRAEVSRVGDRVYFDMVANAFLNRQVRCTVGTLIRVGLGRLGVEEFRDMIRAKKPGLASPAVPPHGLCLMRVNYQENKFSAKGQLDENL